VGVTRPTWGPRGSTSNVHCKRPFCKAVFATFTIRGDTDVKTAEIFFFGQTMKSSSEGMGQERGFLMDEVGRRGEVTELVQTKTRRQTATRKEEVGCLLREKRRKGNGESA